MTSGEHSRPAAIRIVIAEDQALVRRGAALLISMEPDMEVVGQARNGVEAVELARAAASGRGADGPAHAGQRRSARRPARSRRTLPGTQILVLTTLDDDETVFEAVRAGAQAYLLKDAAEDELLETIRALRRGESRLTPQIARKVMDQFSALRSGAGRHAGAPGREPRVPSRGAHSTPTH